MLGAGRVALSCKEQTFDPQYPELMFKPWEQNQTFASVWLLGPGLGQSPLAIETVHQALQNWDSHQQHRQQQHRQQQHNFAWVLDADALNILPQSNCYNPTPSRGCAPTGLYYR
jgi:NAD(P)H-hydrate repair Nnr-like enzyme with NAD(P)H-hydrate dehydratase domain